MILNELIRGLNTIEISGDTSVDIASIVYDSRKVTSGALFVAVEGFTTDGNAFIGEAVRDALDPRRAY